MFRFSIIYFISLFITFECGLTAGEGTLCSIRKSKNQCPCTHEIDTRTNDVVYSMDCSSNEAETFPTYEGIQGLERVYLSFNKIEKLDGSASTTENSVLSVLILSYNSIYYISTDFFEHLVQLKVLDLSHNKISSFVNSNVFSGLSQLEVLDLSFNTISTLPDYIFYPMPVLTELNIGYNYLGLTFTKITNLFNSPLGISKSLTKLKLDGLDIKYILHSFFEGGDKLTHLSVADNPLLEIPTVPYSVTYLDVSGTWISVLKGIHLNYHSLKVLKLNRCQFLETIDRYAFYTLQSLVELEMNDNPKLKELESLAFGILSKKTDIHLKKMSLARCGIQKINETYRFLFKKLEHVDLQGNPFTCDCDIFWLQDYEKSLYRPQNLRCVKPLRLRNKLIMDVPLSELPQCESEEHQRQKIIIIVLSVLITVLIIFVIYLIYLGPFYHHNNYRGIGPDSPYSAIDRAVQRHDESLS